MNRSEIDRALGDVQRRELEQYCQNRTRLDAGDPYRPTYHFSPPGGIVHDPNGACYWNGRYHLFYQFFPPDIDTSTPWDEAMHWGHTVSQDLVHWTDLPIALAPGPGPEKSCYSGQALVEDDRVVFMYHGPGAGNCVATSDDPLLVDVRRNPENPVIPLTEDEEYGIFDPDVWCENGVYYSLSGTQRGDRYGDCIPEAHLFRSADLVDWEYLGPLLDGGANTVPGEDAAVPNFVELDGERILLCFSHHRGPHYYVGEYDGSTHRFEARDHGRMTHGPTTHEEGIGSLGLGTLHAPSVLEAPDGRRIAFFNVTDGADQDGWSQLIALPRVLSLDDADRLTVEPPKELRSLRTNRRSLEGRSLHAGDEVVLDADAGRALEIEATIDLAGAHQVGLSVLRAPDRAEATDVSYYERSGTLELDTTRSTTRTDVPVRPPEQAPLALDPAETLRLRAFVDHSVVEVFANGRQCLTARVYPEREDSDGVSLFVRRGDATLRSATVWDLEGIWNR